MIARRLLLVSALCCWAGTAAVAQGSQMVRIRGTIDAVSPTSIQLTSREGDKLTVVTGDNLTVTEIVPASISDIKSGTFIGTAAVTQSDGSLRALEVQVFPESRRGTGEGYYQYDLQPGSSMVNGTAGDVVGAAGRTLTIHYKGNEKKLVVPQNAPIITYEPGNRAMLVPGAHVIFSATKAADGSLSATRISVGKDGLVPPM